MLGGAVAAWPHVARRRRVNGLLPPLTRCQATWKRHLALFDGRIAALSRAWSVLRVCFAALLEHEWTSRGIMQSTRMTNVGPWPWRKG